MKNVSQADLSLRVKDGFIVIVLVNPSVEISLQKTIQAKAAEGSENRCVFV